MGRNGLKGAVQPLTALHRGHPHIQIVAPRASKMADQEAEYERALEALSGLISGKQRKDSGMWAHAFDMMATYLEVRVGALRAARSGLASAFQQPSNTLRLDAVSQQGRR